MKWSSNHSSLETQGSAPGHSVYFLYSFLVSTCLLGISMWLFNRHFRIKWPTHNFDFLTCPCWVFLFSVNSLTIWPISQTKSLTFTLPSFFLSPPMSKLSSDPINCVSTSSYLSVCMQCLGQASLLSLLATVTATPLGCLCPSLLPLQCFFSVAASVSVNVSHQRTHLPWPLCALLTLVYKSQHDLDTA